MQAFSKIFYVALIGSLLCVTACGSKKGESVPKGIAVPDSMAQVLADMHKLQADLQMGFGQTMHDTSSKAALQNLWKKHNMTEESYNKSMDYYISHPGLLDSVYDKVLNTLSQQKAELMGGKPR